MPSSAGSQVHTDSVPVEREEASQDGARQPPEPQAVLRQVDLLAMRARTTGERESALVALLSGLGRVSFGKREGD